MLTKLSNDYGGNPAYVLAGGGNTSFKDAETLWIKPSGSALAGIQAADFAALDRSKLAAMRSAAYPEDDDARESAVLAGLMAARLPESAHKRPSVETAVHDLFPQALVLHAHPGLVNGLTCGRDGAVRCAELLPDAVWIPECRPGFILARQIAGALDAYKAVYSRDAQIVLHQNHGVFFAADTREEIDALAKSVMKALEGVRPQRPDAAATPLGIPFVSPSGRHVIPFTNELLDEFIVSREAFEPLSKPFTPDHLVYCGAYPRFVGTIREFDPEGPAKITAVQGLGCFACGDTEKAAASARDLFIDAACIAVYAGDFGGYKHMDDEMIGFIANWEVERYRVKQV
jgi:rhamnose utilization protein RhaD (predicted bifunctional aldolase and dehydrogenase)